MSRFRCENCKKSFSTTASPNKIQGFFIDQVQLEELHRSIKRKGSAVDLSDWLFENAIEIDHCPECFGFFIDPDFGMKGEVE